MSAEHILLDCNGATQARKKLDEYINKKLEKSEWLHDEAEKKKMIGTHLGGEWQLTEAVRCEIAIAVASCPNIYAGYRAR